MNQAKCCMTAEWKRAPADASSVEGGCGSGCAIGSSELSLPPSAA